MSGEDRPAFMTPAELTARYRGIFTEEDLARWRADRAGPDYMLIDGQPLYPVEAVHDWEASVVVATSHRIPLNVTLARWLLTLVHWFQRVRGWLLDILSRVP